MYTVLLCVVRMPQIIPYGFSRFVVHGKRNLVDEVQGDGPLTHAHLLWFKVLPVVLSDCPYAVLQLSRRLELLEILLALQIADLQYLFHRREEGRQGRIPWSCCSGWTWCIWCCCRRSLSRRRAMSRCCHVELLSIGDLLVALGSQNLSN